MSMRRHMFVGLMALPVALTFLAMLASTRGTSGLPGTPLAWAQVSSCGNAILDPGEQCDPPGSPCPPGSPGGAMLTCSSDCTCEPPSVGLDHFECYAIKPRRFSPVTATIDDELGSLVERVRAPNRLCVPADKNGEGIGDPTDHLVSHELDPPKSPRFRRTNQPVVNQFGTLHLDILRPSWLLV